MSGRHRAPETADDHWATDIRREVALIAAAYGREWPSRHDAAVMATVLFLGPLLNEISTAALNGAADGLGQTTKRDGP